MRIEQTTDVDRIRPLAVRWLSECRADEFGLQASVETILADLKDWLGTLPGTLLLAYDGVELVGCFAVFGCKSFLGDQTMALEKYWYCLPNAVRAGPALFRAAQKWSQENGCSHLLVSASNLASGKHDKIVRFCTAMGMKHFETSFLCEV